jgi:hypothetical protein
MFLYPKSAFVVLQTNKGGTTAFRPFVRGWESLFYLKGGMMMADGWWWLIKQN